LAGGEDRTSFIILLQICLCKRFDQNQIAFRDPLKRLRASGASVFDFTRIIYGDDEAEAYMDAMQPSKGQRQSELLQGVAHLSGF